MDCKAEETTHNINNAFGPGTANTCTMQWWFKFCRRDKSLEDEEHSGQPPKVGSDHLRAIIETDALKATQEIAEELSIDHSTVIWYLKQTGKVKKPNKWMLHELTENQKDCVFEVSSSFILRNNSEPFLDQIVMCDKKWILYDNQWWPVQWLGLEEAPEHFPKPNLHQKKVMVTVWWSAAVLSTTAFWILAKPSYLRSMLSTSVRCTQNHNAYSWCWSTEWAQFSMTLLTACLITSTLKLNELGYTVLPHPFVWPLANQLPLLQASLQLFAGTILPQPRGCRKCFTRVHQIQKHRFLHYKNKHFLLAKVCVRNDSYFDE